MGAQGKPYYGGKHYGKGGPGKPHTYCQQQTAAVLGCHSQSHIALLIMLKYDFQHADGVDCSLRAWIWAWIWWWQQLEFRTGTSSGGHQTGTAVAATVASDAVTAATFAKR